jgi:hypothetical protein
LSRRAPVTSSDWYRYHCEYLYLGRDGKHFYRRKHFNHRKQPYRDWGRRYLSHHGARCLGRGV